jgi:hypothetical protein
MTPIAPRADPAALVASCAASMTPASPVQRPGPPPLVWPSSPITYVCRPCQPVAPAPVTLIAPAPLTSMMIVHQPIMAVPVTPPMNPHQMVTRAKAGFRMPREPLILAAMTTSMPPSPIPTSVCAALINPNWCVAMEEEYRALMSNGTWELVSRPRGSNIVTSKSIFMYKSL